MKRRLHVIIHGKVQGVNFRWATFQAAIGLGLTGWVKNIADRKVEAIFEGEEADLLKVVDFVKKGPPSSRVTAVEEDWTEATNQFSKFSVNY